jgi:hypothetical protein
VAGLSRLEVGRTTSTIGGVADEVVEVSIGPDGTVAMSVRGVAGMECLTQTEDLVQLLGGDIESRELTDEAYLDVEQDAEDRLWH